MRKKKNISARDIHLVTFSGMYSLLLNNLNFQSIQLLIKYLAEIHYNTFVYFLPQMSPKYLIDVVSSQSSATRSQERLPFALTDSILRKYFQRVRSELLSLVENDIIDMLDRLLQLTAALFIWVWKPVTKLIEICQNLILGCVPG